jgi:hypothetical protein
MHAVYVGAQIGDKQGLNVTVEVLCDPCYPFSVDLVAKPLRFADGPFARRLNWKRRIRRRTNIAI